MCLFSHFIASWKEDVQSTNKAIKANLLGSKSQTKKGGGARILTVKLIKPYNRSKFITHCVDKINI